MSDFRRRLMMMQAKPRRAVAVRTVDGETIPVQTLYDYELEGQVQDELYEQDGKMWLRKNIVEITLGENPMNRQSRVLAVGNLWDFFKNTDNNYVYDKYWKSTNAFFHIVSKTADCMACRVLWTNGNDMYPEARIGVGCWGLKTNTSKPLVRIMSFKSEDVIYTDQAVILENADEINAALSNATIRVAPNIEEQIKTYEVEEIIYE